MSDPVQCVVSYQPTPFFAVSVQTAAGFPVTLPESPAPEVETNHPVSVTVEFINGSPAQVVVVQGTGPEGPPGADGEPGETGPAGSNAEVVLLTLASYLALTPEQQMNGTWYVIPKS